MGTKLQELRDGCFAKAMDDEPMFVLLARDPAAPALVRAWALERKTDIATGKRPASDMAQVFEAEQCATKMEAWRRENDGAWRTGLFANSDDERRPANCRFRLCDEGKPYPRSGCQACGATIATGLGDECRHKEPRP
jgi:hypothetical protein